MTLNEVRRQLDLPDLPNGDVTLNPTYLDALRLANETEQMQQQEEQGGMPGEQGMLPGSDPAMEDEGPQYSDQFGMSNPADAFGEGVEETIKALNLTYLDALMSKKKKDDD
jgi:hypothetical protein